MTPLFLLGGLVLAAAVAVLWPSSAARRLPVRADDADQDRRRALLRQLRDLDDDLAAGKLTEDDHRRLRAPLEREAGAVLRRVRHDLGQHLPASAIRAATSRPRPATRDVGPPGRTRRRIVTVLAVAAGVAGVLVVLANAITPRGAGQPISGDAPGTVSATAEAAGPGTGRSGQPSLTAQQVASIDSAAVAVKRNPKDVAAHLRLAHAYADGGLTQLAAVEYLAVTRLDPTNAEADTALALLAFEVGRTGQGKKLVDRALAAHPDYPEALYVRALILLMGLHQPGAAARDLNAYLAVAPFGSHRTAAETLLALAGSQGRR
jgi:tetratricopeptide (TPR) repeat protein